MAAAVVSTRGGRCKSHLVLPAVCWWQSLDNWWHESRQCLRGEKCHQVAGLAICLDAGRPRLGGLSRQRFANPQFYLSA
jgi:hypothetical protein